MQLKRRKTSRGVAPALGLLTANLLLATAALAAPLGPAAPPPVANANINDDTETDLGLTRVDSAVLFYHEANGRVQTTEPMISVAFNSEDGDVLSVKLTSDTLTGATPNGAAPWKQAQTFTTPAQAPGSTAVVTSASGGSSLVTLPGTGTVVRQYTTPAHQLPTDTGFRDQRYAVDASYAMQWTPESRVSIGGSVSTERDYRSGSINAGYSRDLFQKNTTVSVGLNLEFDQSRPYFGTPTPLTVMSGDAKGGNKSKTVENIVIGVTQVMNRIWLANLNYSAGQSDGYQTDPYRIISVVDPATGGPTQYLYESRPSSRFRQSLYMGNKIALGPTFADVSLRAYHDSWGINSITAEINERIPLLSWIYVEPQARYYSQTAATFFHDYLVSGQPLPTYASSDSRLGKFSATTLGLKLGIRTGSTSEFYMLAENYKQSGKSTNPNAIGDLASENLFSGVNATSLVLGFTFAFR